MIYTHATWTVKPGREDEFVRAWLELADWTVEEMPGAEGTLLRDLDRSNRFVSFGPWRSVEEAERWRGSAGFRERVDRIRGLLESFEPETLELVLSTS